jgi:hypothetical protein
MIIELCAGEPGWPMGLRPRSIRWINNSVSAVWQLLRLFPFLKKWLYVMTIYFDGST